MATALRCRHAGPTQAASHADREIVVVPNRDGLPDTADAAQIIVEKQTVDVFETLTIAPTARSGWARNRFVVYGVVRESLRLARGARFAASRKAGDDCDDCRAGAATGSGRTRAGRAAHHRRDAGNGERSAAHWRVKTLRQ